MCRINVPFLQRCLSFAYNRRFGENILPISPNPTSSTPAINRFATAMMTTPTVTMVLIFLFCRGFSNAFYQSTRTGDLKKYSTNRHATAKRKDTTLDHSSLTEHKVTIPKPMGLILEEIDEQDPYKGVVIAKVNPEGNAAAACKSGLDLCIRDKILAVNDEPCADSTFEVVMERIASSPGDIVSLKLGRILGSVAVRWPNGVCVAATPGEYLGNIADDALFRIQYSCTSGSCGTCEHRIRNENGDARFVRPCVARVPKGSASIEVSIS